MEIVIISDDLTGATDTLLPFARRGLKSIAFLDLPKKKYMSSMWEKIAAVAITTESRAVSAEKARAHVREVAQFFKGKDILFYKKIDSTLRGNIGAEIDEIMDTLGYRCAVVCPAFPGQGRTVVDGCLFVYGQPLDNTEMITDPKTPVNESRIAALIGKASNRKIIEISPTGIRDYNGILVVDAQTDEDLAQIVKATMQLNQKVLLAGSAGMATQLAMTFHQKILGKGFNGKHAVDLPVLCVIGTLSRTTDAQVHEVEKQLNAAIMNLHNHSAAVQALRDGRDVILRTQMNTHYNTNPCEKISAIACRIMQKSKFCGLIVSGGDTAIALCRQMHVDKIEIIGKVMEGVPVGRIIGGEFNGTDIITKAGAFGDNDALVRAINYLRN